MLMINKPKEGEEEMMNFGLKELFGNVEFGKSDKSLGLYGVDVDGNLAVLNAGGSFVSFGPNGLSDVSSMKFDGIDTFILPVNPASLRNGDVILTDDDKPLFIYGSDTAVVKVNGVSPFQGVTPEGQVQSVLPKRSLTGDFMYVSAVISLFDIVSVAERFANDDIFLLAAMQNTDPSLQGLKAMLMMGGMQSGDAGRPGSRLGGIDPLMLAMMSGGFNGNDSEGGMQQLMPLMLMRDADMDPMMMMLLMNQGEGGGLFGGGNGGGNGGMMPFLMMRNRGGNGGGGLFGKMFNREHKAAPVAAAPTSNDARIDALASVVVKLSEAMDALLTKVDDNKSPAAETKEKPKKKRTGRPPKVNG